MHKPKLVYCGEIIGAHPTMYITLNARFRQMAHDVCARESRGGVFRARLPSGCLSNTLSRCTSSKARLCFAIIISRKRIDATAEYFRRDGGNDARVLPGYSPIAEHRASKPRGSTGPALVGTPRCAYAKRVRTSEPGLELFCNSILKCVMHQRHFGIHFFELGVLGF